MSSHYRSSNYGSGGNESLEGLTEFLTHDESPTARTLFAGNVDARVTRKMLYELMVQAGPVESINLVPPKEHATKTMAFVRFEHAVSVRYAMLVLDQVTLFRSSLSLNYSGVHKAKPRPRYPPFAPTFFEIPPGLDQVNDTNKELLVSVNAIPPLSYLSGYFLTPQPSASPQEIPGQNYGYGDLDNHGSYTASASYRGDSRDARSHHSHSYGSRSQDSAYEDSRYSSSTRHDEYYGGYENYSNRDYQRSFSAGYSRSDSYGYDNQRNRDRHDAYPSNPHKRPRR
ncbi:RNA-binding protein 7-like [Paramacrobiotus metropolitanus]|uniref:RNA-binding protein 7-like n=1 Tax=Paramacrobiotus metropolitanus TaxID=2943436 RepID=UPI002445CC63|nr:RNA-binding protein 7-like [Paramacrobiotus metropolitanus]